MTAQTRRPKIDRHAAIEPLARRTIGRES